MDVIWIIFLFAFGGCVGSFLNVVIYRMPRGMSIAWPGSHCPGCGVAIKWYDNIPILSWLVLRAKCRACGTRISPRYVLIELLTAVLVAGLYVCLFMLGMREGIDDFTRQWPLYLSWAVLICGLIACSAVDVELFIVPLPVMWFCAAVGILAAGMFPSAFAGRASENGDRIVALMPTVSPAVAAATLAACAGLVIAKVLLHYGFLQESFVDADDRPAPTQPAPPAPTNRWVEALREFLYIVPAAALGIAVYLLIMHSQWLEDVLRARMADRTLEPLVGRIMVFAGLMAAVVIATLWTRLARAVGDRLLGNSPFARTGEQAEEPQVAYTSAHGVNPRLEILREVAFLAPSAVLAAGAFVLVARVEPLGRAMGWLMDEQAGWRFAAHAGAAMGAVFGMMLAVALVWGIRILGTLAFGKEAMGMGDVHILAAVGAAGGWAVAAVTFFAAPLLGVVYVLHCTAAGRGRREIPYGPWLAAGAMVVLLFYDRIVGFVKAGG